MHVCHRQIVYLCIVTSTAFGMAAKIDCRELHHDLGAEMWHSGAALATSASDTRFTILILYWVGKAA